MSPDIFHLKPDGAEQVIEADDAPVLSMLICSK